MSFQLRLSHQAQRDIEEVLAWTLREFGSRQYVVYQQLIHQALREVARHPESARLRPEIHPSARTYPLARGGAKARHFLLLRLADDQVVEVGRLLHDSMDLPAHLPPGYQPAPDRP